MQTNVREILYLKNIEIFSKTCKTKLIKFENVSTKSSIEHFFADYIAGLKMSEYLRFNIGLVQIKKKNAKQ